MMAVNPTSIVQISKTNSYRHGLLLLMLRTVTALARLKGNKLKCPPLQSMYCGPHLGTDQTLARSAEKPSPHQQLTPVSHITDTMDSSPLCSPHITDAHCTGNHHSNITTAAAGAATTRSCDKPTQHQQLSPVSHTTDIMGCSSSLFTIHIQSSQSLRGRQCNHLHPSVRPFVFTLSSESTDH